METHTTHIKQTTPFDGWYPMFLWRPIIAAQDALLKSGSDSPQ